MDISNYIDQSLLNDPSANLSGLPLQGDENQSTVNHLLKALEARDITGRDTAGLETSSGAPLKVESLEAQLKVVTFNNETIRLWRKYPKKTAYNTVEEYNQLRSYGNDFSGGFNLESELPEEENSTYVRESEKIKYMGTVRSVSYPMTLVRTQEAIGNIITRENENGTLWILRRLSRALTKGNERIISTEVNGLYELQRKGLVGVGATPEQYFTQPQVIDKRGDFMKEPDFNKGANQIVEGFGLADTFWAPPSVISDFTENFYGNKFIPLNTEAIANGKVGQKVQSFQSQFGEIGMDFDLFMKRRPNKVSTAGKTSTKAPDAPNVTAVAVTATDALSRWDAGDAADYYYAVSAINRYGESSLAVFATAASAVSDSSIDVTFAPTAGVYNSEGYVIYRSNKDAASVAEATFFPLFEVSEAERANGYDGGGAGVVRDRNRILPDTEQAFLIEWNTQVLEIGQLAPLTKMDLALLGPAQRWMILLYLTQFLYAPLRMVRYINIGRA